MEVVVPSILPSVVFLIYVLFRGVVMFILRQCILLSCGLRVFAVWQLCMVCYLSLYTIGSYSQADTIVPRTWYLISHWIRVKMVDHNGNA